MDKRRPGRPPNRQPNIDYPSEGAPSTESLAAVFAQIDEAKRELDKRFVLKSDVLRTEVEGK